MSDRLISCPNRQVLLGGVGEPKRKKPFVLPIYLAARRRMVERNHPSLSLRRQCDLLSLSRSGLYYEEVGLGVEDYELMRMVDEIYTRHSFYGYRRVTATLKRLGHHINGKRVLRIMRAMELEAVYPKKRTSISSKENRVYPYLLRRR